MSKPYTTYSSRQLVRFAATVFAVVWATQIYGAVGNHPTLAWLYVPLILLCRFSVAVYALVFVIALIANDITGAKLPVAEIGIGVQAALVALMARRGRLLRVVQEDAAAGRSYRALLRLARPWFIALATALAAGMLFRGKPAVECACWSICCFAVALAIPSRHVIQWRNAVPTAALALFSIMAGAAVLEAGTRLLLPPPPVSSEMYDPDPDYIFTLRPNARSGFGLRVSEREEINVDAIISPQGIRDRVIGPKQPNEFRIVMIGDSYTMGHGLPPEHNIPHVLETLLNEHPSAERFTVINCGVGGYAPWQERGFLNARGFGFKPDLVILQVFPANDVAGTLTRVGKHLQAADVGWENRIAAYRSKNTFPASFQRWLENHAFAYVAIARAIGKPNLAVDIIGGLRFVPHTYLAPLVKSAKRNPYREASLIEWNPELKEGYRLMEEDIRGIRDDCRARGVDLIAYSNPFPMGVLADGFEEFDKKTEGVLFEKNRDVHVTEDIFARADIPFVDVTAALESQPDESALYFLYDGHFTQDGAAVVARAIAGYLQQTYLPQRGPKQ